MEHLNKFTVTNQYIFGMVAGWGYLPHPPLVSSSPADQGMICCFFRKVFQILMFEMKTVWETKRFQTV